MHTDTARHQIAINSATSPLTRIGAKIAEAYAAFKARRAQYRQRRIDRQAFEHMLALDDKMLKDIGVTRNDVIWASQLPRSENASQELYRVSLEGKGVRNAG